jgi:hypothetical protein
MFDSQKASFNTLKQANARILLHQSRFLCVPAPPALASLSILSTFLLGEVAWLRRSSYINYYSFHFLPILLCKIGKK